VAEKDLAEICLYIADDKNLSSAFLFCVTFSPTAVCINEPAINQLGATRVNERADNLIMLKV
jgi:hypothetical protein